MLIVEEVTNGALQMQAGRREVFVDNLPGYPDGITNGSEGTYWLSLVSLNSPALETMLKTRLAAVSHNIAQHLCYCWEMSLPGYLPHKRSQTHSLL